MGRGRSQASMALINMSWTILEEIQPATVRAVCYRLFTLGLIASMKKQETNRVSRLLTGAREDGLIPWSWIVDETRDVEGVPSWDSPAQYLEAIKRSYRKDHWALQPIHAEVWSEKGTVRGTLQPVLNEFGIPFRVMHGYGSATALHSIAQECADSGKPWLVFYVGDFDPSGLHMSVHDIPTRLDQYGSTDQEIDVRRIALIEDDLQDLPSFEVDTKRSDPRYQWYLNVAGKRLNGRCWELDALSPVVLRSRVHAAIQQALDREQWNRSILAEEAEQSSMRQAFSGLERIFGQAS